MVPILETDPSGYKPGTKSHALNEVHCMLQDFQQAAPDDEFEFEFDKAYALIEAVRDQVGE